MRLSILVAITLSLLTFESNLVRADGGIFHHRKPPIVIVPSAPATVPSVSPAPSPVPTPMPPGTAEPPMMPSPIGLDSSPSPTFSPLVSAALGDSSFAVNAPGYLDSALPMNVLRFRYDAAYNMNRPDRAEYFYAKCGCFGMGAPGPILPERSVDVQETSLYAEFAPVQRLSVFIDLPIRAINPEVNDNATGIGDLRFGFKYAFIYTEDHVVSLQVRGWAPTGDARRGLGTDHTSIEPSLLYLGKLSDRVTIFGQFGEWIPIGGTDFAGNILTYGVGAGYTLSDSGRFRVTPLAEVLGWTVLDGNQTNLNFPNATQTAGGDTIINGKLGVRAGNDRHDIYVGYGRALTGEVWYEDIVRFEYRLKF